MASEFPIYATAENTSGRTFIVTGSNIGFGFEAAQHLVAAGAAKVILAVRNVPAGEEAKAKIEASTGRTGVAEVWEVDLANYGSVKAFAKKAATDLDRIDAVVQNAGLIPKEKSVAEGHSLIVTVNILSTFLLTFLLLPKLSESAAKYGTLPHMAIVGSSYGFQKEFWDTVKDDPLAKLDAEEDSNKA
jgi:NAD(P)-dependent dehydrogenase (short-subunit alcohol dehydrogenase family)